MKGIHKLIVTPLLLITFVDTSPTKTKPTLITLKLNSSEIVNDSEGRKSFERLKPSNLFRIFPKTKFKHDYVEHLKFDIRQLDDNSFEILGSPIDWPQYEGSVK
tara:strand:- start:273 stop:584 length:312 start_codon:yes stop_codon:yes gene_type:complete